VQLIGFTDAPQPAAPMASTPRNSLPPGETLGGFEDEATQYLQELELEAMIVPAPGSENGGFEEESTHIFFNKEEGVGVPALLQEINDVQDKPLGLNKPIIAAELGLPGPSLAPSPVRSFARPPAPISHPGNASPFGDPLQAPPPAAGIPIQAFASQPPDRPVATQTRRPGSTLSGLQAPMLPPLQAPPPAAAAPPPQHLPPAPSHAAPPQQYAPPPQQQYAPSQPQAPMVSQQPPVLVPSGPRTVRQQAPAPSASSTWVFAGAIVMLLVVIGALVVLTPLGIALGVRKASVGSIEVRTEPPTRAAVLLDDIHRGSAPLRLDRVPAGLHRIEVRGPGYLPSTRELQVWTGKTVLLQMDLVPDGRVPP
jgi:hypothetical protein